MLNLEQIKNGMAYANLKAIVFQSGLMHSSCDYETRTTFQKKYDKFFQKDFCSGTWSPENPEVLSMYAHDTSYHNGDIENRIREDFPLDLLLEKVINDVLYRHVKLQADLEIQAELNLKHQNEVLWRSTAVLTGLYKKR